MLDWEDHLTTAFPEVRLKRFLEMRGADGGPWRELCALPAFWAGLLYDDASLEAAWDITAGWSMAERLQLRKDTPKLGLKAMVDGRVLRDVARELLQIAHQGLASRGRLNTAGDDETGFLAPLLETVESGLTPAERKLEAYYGRWKESVDPIFEECAY